MTIDCKIEHIRNRSYMSGIDRDDKRIQSTGEVFTPTELVSRILDQLDQSLFSNPTKTFIDPTCGDGQFLGEVLIRKLENNIDFETALTSIYGVDLMPDNVKLCQDRLLCGHEEFRHIVKKNIVCANTLEYDFLFKNNELYGINLFDFD